VLVHFYLTSVRALVTLAGRSYLSFSSLMLPLAGDRLLRLILFLMLLECKICNCNLQSADFIQKILRMDNPEHYFHKKMLRRSHIRLR
jgi:hypothetical protein